MALGLLAGAPSELERVYRETITRLGEDHALLLAERDGETVGMAQLVRAEAANARHRAEVRRVAVAARARGAGIGARLMNGVEQAARTRGITLLWLTTHAGTAACAFYEALGYTRLGVMPKYSARPDGSLADGAFFYRELA
jgi:GNAT superfamily N-acetyltransferase